MKLKTLAILALFPLAAGTADLAHAQNRDKSWEFGPYVTSTNFDNDLEIEDDSGAGFRFGYNFTAMHELEFSFDGVDTQDDVINAIDVSVGKFQVNYLFNFVFDRHQTVIPYLTAGLGAIRFEVDDPFFGSDEETDDLLSLGGGIRFFFGRRFNIRVDARKIFFEGDNVVLRDFEFENTELSAGVGWVLGGR